jgi:hypothetical protein
MKASKPVICTLTSNELRARRDKWSDILRSATAEVQPLPDGVSVRLARDDAVLHRLHRLVELETVCCQWLLLDLSEDAGATVLTMRAESDEGVEAIRTLVWANP